MIHDKKYVGISCNSVYTIWPPLESFVSKRKSQPWYLIGSISNWNYR